MARGKGLSKGLGKGLDSIFGDNKVRKVIEGTEESLAEENLTADCKIKTSLIQPDKNQPRKDFDEDKLRELADSIKEVGIISPIVVKKNGQFFDIVAGERRWRAARMAGLKEVPVVIRDIDEKTSRAMSIIENVQRDDLNPIEEALGYQVLIDQFGMTQEEVAKKVSKNRATVANSLRLLKLDDDIQQLLRNKMITQGHARALLGIEDKDIRKKVAGLCAEKNLSVREIEEIVKKEKTEKENRKNGDSDEVRELKRLKIIYKDLEKQMKSSLGTKVSILPKTRDKGVLQIEYYTQEDLDRFFTLLKGSRE